MMRFEKPIACFSGTIDTKNDSRRGIVGSEWAAHLQLRIRGIVLPLLLAWTGSLSCAVVSKLNLLTTEDEVEIGRQAAREVEKSMEMYKDPVVEAYIDSLGQALVKHSRRSNIRYSFKVVDTDQVNAFALPGGWLYVNRGLITAAENESELAGVVGHEIGHVVGRHGARQISKQYGLAVLVGLVAGFSIGKFDASQDHEKIRFLDLRPACSGPG